MRLLQLFGSVESQIAVSGDLLVGELCGRPELELLIGAGLAKLARGAL